MPRSEFGILLLLKWISFAVVLTISMEASQIESLIAAQQPQRSTDHYRDVASTGNVRFTIKEQKWGVVSLCCHRADKCNYGERGSTSNAEEDADRATDDANKVPMKTYSVAYGVGYALGPIAAASVLCWVGVWDLQDTFLFPGNDLYSGLACLSLAMPLAVVVHVMSRREDHKSDSVPFVLLISLCGIEFWRGVWLVWESLVLPQNRPAQSVAAILLGVGILMATGHFTSLVVGPAVMFPEDHDDKLNSTINSQNHREFKTKSSDDYTLEYLSETEVEMTVPRTRE